MSFEARRSRWLGVTGALLLCFLAVVALVPVQYVVLSPGPTFNTIGEVDGVPLIKITGHRTYPTSGNLQMTTVSERGGPFGGLYVSRALQYWADPTVRVLPTEALYPEGESTEQVEQQNQEDFVDSQDVAVAAALRHLDIPVVEQAVVSSVADGTPAEGALQPGDVIVSVDGTAVTRPEEVGPLVRARAPGDVITMVVIRGGKRTTVPVKAADSPTKPGQAYLGIAVGAAYTAPFDIDFTLDQVGGPSAGLMFSLGIVDKLTPGPLTGGRFVAGTGTIAPDGAVGPIGGIAQKLLGARAAGATLFLAPASNCDEVTGHVPDGLTVAAVSTMDDALAALREYEAGRPVTGCG